MIIVSGKIYVRPGTKETFLSRSAQTIAQARSTAGCLDFVLAADPIEPDRVNVYEEWVSEEALSTFRGEGPDNDVSASILKANVAQHTVSSTEQL